MWLKELTPRACELMSACELPEVCKGALVSRGGARSPLKQAGLKSLRDALLAIIPFQQGEPLAHFFELDHRHPAQALNLILHSRPVL